MFFGTSGVQRHRLILDDAEPTLLTHRLSAVGAVTSDHKITTDNKLYKL